MYQGTEARAIMHNALTKTYPDGGTKTLVADRPIFRERGWEERGSLGGHGRRKLSRGRCKLSRRLQGKGRLRVVRRSSPDREERERDNLERSKRRARSAVYDLARSTDFRYFVTLTVSPEKVDRLDDEAVFKKLHNWLDNNVRRHGLTYVLIPEYHKKGGLHFHAFFNDALPAVDSGTLSVPGVKRPRKPRSEAERRRLLDGGAHIVYNLPGWDFGFTTALELYGDRRAAVGYVVKYITKAERKIGGRWYYSGGNLRRPEVRAHDLDFDAAYGEAGSGFEIGSLGAICCSLEG